MLQLACTEEQRLGAPASEIWAFRLDFLNLPAYNPQVSEVEQITVGEQRADGKGPGAQYRFLLATPQGSRPILLEVTEAQDARRVAATMTGALFAREVFELRDEEEGHCEVVLSLWMDLPDGLPDSHAGAILAGGASQIRSELDAMARLFPCRDR